MASPIKTLLGRFTDCYSLTNSAWQSLRYAFKVGSSNKISISVKGIEIQIRKNCTDEEVLLAAFQQRYHRSWIHLGKQPVIIDLGANIGLTMIDMKLQYPDAVIIGVELDADNYALLKQNITRLNNCSALHAAIWKQDGWISYEGKDNQSYSIIPNSYGHTGLVQCLTMDTLLNQKNTPVVDYLKMDIEGSEYDVLMAPGSSSWLRNIKCLSIEIHDTSFMNKADLTQQLSTKLQDNNFIVLQSGLHWSSLFAFNKTFFFE